MKQALYQASTVTFEEFSFIFPAERDADSEVSAKDCLNIAIDFAGPLNGKFVLRIEREVLPAVAANMLGEDAPFGEEILCDVAGEIANVICGNALPAIGGKDAVFNLSAPQQIAPADFSEKPSAEAKLEMEEGRADVLLFIT